MIEKSPHETTQLRRFWSRWCEPLAEATDVMDHEDWGAEDHIHAFPPPSPLLIPQVLHKALAENATITIVTPVWESQPWWGLLMGSLGQYWTLTTHPLPLTEPLFDSSATFGALAVWTSSGSRG